MSEKKASNCCLNVPSDTNNAEVGSACVSEATNVSNESSGGIKTEPNVEVKDSVRSGIKDFVTEELKFGRLLGKGSCGHVFLATYHKKSVAVKRLHAVTHRTGKTNERLEKAIAREASILEWKRSSHIVSLLHYNSEKKWLVMQYCENGSLHDVLLDESKRGTVLDWSNRLKWMKDVAAGMNILHNEKPFVLHRNIKTTNVFFDASFQAKIGDFGVSKVLENESDLPSIDSFNDIRMAWQPPEVFFSGTHSKKSDVYSFGVVMHAVLTLTDPYRTIHSNPDQTIQNISTVTNVAELIVPENRSELPGIWHPYLEDYIDVMKDCLAHNPDARPEFGPISRRLKETKQRYKKYVVNQD